MLVVTVALSPMSAHAFTLIQPVVKLFVNPHAGYTTSLVQVRGTVSVNNTCTGAPITFQFLFDNKALWTRGVSSCKNSLWDTGLSPYTKPPVPPTVGSHTILLNVYGSTNNLLGTARYAFAIYPAPASPTPRSSPTPPTSPRPFPSPSPSPSACAARATLPPAGTGGLTDNLIAGVMIAVAIGIGALAMYGPGTLLALARRRRPMALVTLSLGVLLTASCTSTVGQGSPSDTPAAAVSPTPSPSPSC